MLTNITNILNKEDLKKKELKENMTKNLSTILVSDHV